jgi:hypothetical protein
MINATNEGSSFTPIEAGNYPARCYSMIHIGTCMDSYMGEPKEFNKVRITWELPTEMRVFKEEKDEQPVSISKEFTLSMNEKSNLRKFLAAWRGKDFTEEEAKCFDITKLLGKECMLSIIHKVGKSNGKIYAEISGCATVPKGMKVDKQINPSFEFSYDNFDQDKFDSLQDWIKDKMKQSKEYKAIANPQEALSESREEQLNPEGDDLPL